MTSVLIGTATELVRVSSDGRESLLDGPVTHIALHDGLLWALCGDRVFRGAPDALEHITDIPAEARFIGPTTHGTFIGTAEAHLLVVTDHAAQPVGTFDAAPGRDDWYTPWGGPPDARSLTQADDGTIFVNVHVGGVVRSRDAGASWEQTLDIDADIHQVLATDGMVVAPGAYGLNVSTDGGDSWEPVTRGFDTTYMRAVTVAGDSLLVSAARSHAGGDVGIYRRTLRSTAAFERASGGLPRPVSEHNIDTHRLDGNGAGAAAFVTEEGTVYHSTDAGQTWQVIAEDIEGPRCLVLA